MSSAPDGGVLSIEHVRALREASERQRRAAERERLLPQMRAHLVRIAAGVDDVELETVAGGPCHDCGSVSEPRFRYGRVDLCLRDLIGRRKVRARLEAA